MASSFTAKIYRNFQPKITYWSRYLEFRFSLSRLAWSTRDSRPFAPLTLVDHKETSREGIPLQWRITDDRVLGGYSKSSVARIDSWEQYREVARTTTSSPVVADPTPNNNKTNSSPFPFLHWHGTIDTTVGLHSRAQRSGFANIQSPPIPVDLETNYQALEITARGTPGRVFGVQLYMPGHHSAHSDDMYQGQLVFAVNTAENADENTSNTTPTEFETFLLPFSGFTAVGGGRQRHRRLDQKIVLERIGLMLADEVDGEFWMDVRTIRAVNLNDAMPVMSVYEGPPEEEEDGGENDSSSNGQQPPIRQPDILPEKKV